MHVTATVSDITSDITFSHGINNIKLGPSAKGSVIRLIKSLLCPSLYLVTMLCPDGERAVNVVPGPVPLEGGYYNHLCDPLLKTTPFNFQVNSVKLVSFAAFAN